MRASPPDLRSLRASREDGFRPSGAGHADFMERERGRRDGPAEPVRTTNIAPWRDVKAGSRTLFPAQDPPATGRTPRKLKGIPTFHRRFAAESA